MTYRHIPIQILPWILWYQKHFIPQETIYKHKLTSVLTDVETNLLSWTNESSQIYKVNADSEKIRRFPMNFPDIWNAFEIAKDSDGAFDPTIGKLIRLWILAGENQKIPEEAEIKNVLKDSGYQKVSFDGTTIRMDEDVRWILVQPEKGISCDSILEYLKHRRMFRGAYEPWEGNSVMTYGSKPDGSSWNVAVTVVLKMTTIILV